MTKIQELQKKIKGIRKKILKLKRKSPNYLHQINELIDEELKILNEIKLKVEIEKKINLEKKKLSIYSTKISYSSEQSKKLKKLSESYNKKIDIKRLLKKKKKKRKKKRKKKKYRKNFRKQTKGGVKIKTSFQIMAARSYRPQPINRQAARAVGNPIKKK